MQAGCVAGMRPQAGREGFCQGLSPLLAGLTTFPWIQGAAPPPPHPPSTPCASALQHSSATQAGRSLHHVEQELGGAGQLAAAETPR
jgi:hypothetical protein